MASPSGNVGHASPPSSTPTSESSPSSLTPPSPTPTVHPMLTRARAGIFKPNPRYALSSTSVTPASSSTADVSPLPSSVRVALRDPNWRAAMESEYNALLSNRTWRLVDRPLGAHTISGKWVFTHKLKPDGSLDRYKS
jgi:histone deacetylase 1/2